MKKVAILGSTGSIGTQTLEVISDNKNIFKVELLTAYSNHTLLINQALLYKPKAIIFGDKSKEKVILNSLKNEEIEIYFGENLVCEEGSINTNINNAKLNNYMKKNTICINVFLNIGEKNHTVFGNDLSNEYIRINSDYRS